MYDTDTTCKNIFFFPRNRTTSCENQIAYLARKIYLHVCSNNNKNHKRHKKALQMCYFLKGL